MFSGSFDVVYVEGIYCIGFIYNKIGFEFWWYIGGYVFVLNEFIIVFLKKYCFNGVLLVCKFMVVNWVVMLDMDFVIFVY